MKTYWVSAIVTYKGCEKPWLLSYGSCNLSLEEAMGEIEHIKNTFTALSIWIDTYDNNNVKQTVFHECYIDAFGYVTN